jgi:hypothetical protein
MNILERPSKDGERIIFYFNYGERGPGQRPSSGIFIYTHPKDQIEKNYNKQALILIETKKSQLTLEQQAIGLQGSLNHFKVFLESDAIAPVDIIHNLCFRFRKYLL